MNYNENRAGNPTPSTRPMDMYSIKSQVQNQSGLVTDALVNLAQVTTDHAFRIDALRDELGNLQSLLMWISEVHPDVIKQHFALRDIERANK